MASVVLSASCVRFRTQSRRNASPARPNRVNGGGCMESGTGETHGSHASSRRCPRPAPPDTHPSGPERSLRRAQACRQGISRQSMHPSPSAAPLRHAPAHAGTHCFRTHPPRFRSACWVPRGGPSSRSGLPPASLSRATAVGNASRKTDSDRFMRPPRVFGACPSARTRRIGWPAVPASALPHPPHPRPAASAPLLPPCASSSLRPSATPAPPPQTP